MTTRFECYRDIVISGSQHFHQANGNIYNHYVSNSNVTVYGKQTSETLMPNQGQYDEVRRGHIIQRGQVSSEDIEMVIQRPLKQTNPFRNRVVARTINIKKQQYTAELVQYNGRMFTVIVFEPEDTEDKDTIKMIWKKAYEAASTYMSPLLTHLYGLGRLDAPALIMHDELASGLQISDQYSDNQTVKYYLMYTHLASFVALRDDRTLSDLVSPRWENWAYNLTTHSWQYDLASASLSSSSPRINYNPGTQRPLRQNTLPRLDFNEIAACFEVNFGDFLYPHTRFSWATAVEPGLESEAFAVHGLLTFGTVVHSQQGVLAHFPFVSAPRWYCQSENDDIEAKYSRSVASRVDLSFHRSGETEVKLDFSLALSENDRTRFCAAYLSQSLDLPAHDDQDIVFIHEFRFRLRGTFPRDPSPAFLFVPPVPVQHFDGMHCLCYPLPTNLFYWSLDPHGATAIPKEDWREYGIPDLEMTSLIGSQWNDEQYKSIREYLHRKSYAMDGRQYARDHDYPQLVRGDPHGAGIADLEELDADDWTNSLHYQLLSF
ncbi:hypothetical protein PQX77_003672 [Marasmius sp. AFHP31]|nr:hypothetical protein PQX77_003672 [Marasmius sp. AFHP31]